MLKSVLLLAACARAAALSGGGAQAYHERLAAHHVAHGAVAHPPRASRPNVLSSSAPGAAAFRLEAPAAPPTRFTHFFEESVGSGHMALTARADWREHLAMAARDLGVKRIRGHGLLDDDMSVSYARGKNAYYNVDRLADFLISIGMRPIFELSFMPGWLASGESTVCHYKGRADPPTSYALWGEVIGALGAHMVERYGESLAGEFFFEVWNEPNDNFWKGNQTQYWQLYSAAARALKAASPALRVGGPATCCADCWIGDFVAYCNASATPFDFVSTHAYSSCGMDGLGSVGKVVGALQKGRADLDAAQMGGGPAAVPWLVTEFGDNCAQGIGDPSAGSRFPSAIHDMVDQAAYTLAVVDKLANANATDASEPQALSYWAVSDVFEESFFPVHNESFHGAFGLVNLHGVPKPTYRAYQLLHESGEERLAVTPLQDPHPAPTGACGVPMDNTDVWGGDVPGQSPVDGVASLADCCQLCQRNNEGAPVG